MQTFEVYIPELDDTESVEAVSARKAILDRLKRIDEDIIDDLNEIEVVVHDDFGIRSEYVVKPLRTFRFLCAKVD